MNRNRRNNFHVNRKVKKSFNMTKKSKKILLITGLSTIGAAVVAIPTGLSLTNKLPNSKKQPITLDTDFLKSVSTFILQNKILSSQEFNERFTDEFANFLSEKFRGATFVVTSSENKISVQITNDFDFNTEIQLENVTFSDLKNLEINVSWYNPVQFSIPANSIYNFIQNYITTNKTSSLSNLVKNQDFKQKLVTQINDLNQGLGTTLNVDDIILNSPSSYSLTISIQSYIDKIFTLTNVEQNSNVSINDPEYQKEILINNLVLFNAKVSFNNESVNKIQQLSMQQGLIAPSYFSTANTIKVTNEEYINAIIDILNSGTTDEYKVDKSNISNISYSLVNKTSSYNELQPNVAKINFTITLSNGYFIDEETNNDNFTLSNNNRTINITLYAYNGIFVNERMSTTSTNINKFISANGITLSSANDAINSKYGQYAEFWYTLLTGNDFQDVTDEYYESIDLGLYQMECNDSSISITLNENCGFRFYADTLQNGDIVISNNYRTITINNIIWTRGTTNISTTNATLDQLTQIFTENGIYEPSLIDPNKQRIINTLFPRLPVANCSILYDNGTITFTINNSPDANTNYMFDINGVTTNVYKISNVTFPAGKIYPVENYENLVQTIILNNLISNQTQLETYMQSIISQIFGNSLKQGQYTTSIDSNLTTVTVNINSDTNLEFVTTTSSPSEPGNDNEETPPTIVESTSKSFTFNIKLCKEVGIINNYQESITPEILQENQITSTNIQSRESIVKILNLIVDPSTTDKANLINSIADLLVLNYSTAPYPSKIIIPLENSTIIQNPFTFVVDGVNISTLSIIFDFNTEETPTTPSQSIISKFFRGY